MSRLHVEGWSPEYGASIEPDEELRADEGSVDVDVEGRPWEPIEGSDDGIPVVAFVDGVRRIDARLVLDEPDGPVPGLCGTFAIGAVLWDRSTPASEFTGVEVHRTALLAGGHRPDLPELGLGLVFATEAVDDDDPAKLVGAFHDGMRRAEARLAEELASGGYFVVADGPLYECTPVPKLGYAKSHRRFYLPAEQASIVGELVAGQRTPVFAIGEGRHRRYSWYLRLADRAHGHSWSGIARCEAAAAIGLEAAVLLADRSAAILPVVGSAAHLDPRAPQNLVPIASLEGHLRHLMGDAGLVERSLRAALGQAA